MIHFDYHRPETVEEALALKASIAGAVWLAGGTDLIVRAKSGLERPPAVISLRGIDALSGIDARGEGLRIGALTPLSDVQSHATVNAYFPVLTAAIARMGSVQIRNVATLAGNLCNASPCADSAPPLIVYGARLVLRGPAGERTVSVRDFFHGPRDTARRPGELVTAVDLDAPSPGARGVFFKKGRVAMDLALVNLAALVEMDGEACRSARLATGAVGPVPIRLTEVEALVEGEALTDARIAEAAALAMASVSPITDVRAGADYRRHLVGVYTRRALEALREGSEA